MTELKGVDGLFDRYKEWKRVVRAHLRSIGIAPDAVFSSRPFEERRLIITSRCEIISNAARLLSIKGSLAGRGADFTSSAVDYRDCPVRDGAVIYADPPYKGTTFCSNKTKRFDHEAFYDWAESQRSLTLISEYGMPEDRFSVVFEVGKANFGHAGGATSVKERLYVPKGQVGMYREMMGGLQL